MMSAGMQKLSHLDPELAPLFDPKRPHLHAEFSRPGLYTRLAFSNEIIGDLPLVLIKDFNNQICARRNVVDVPVFIPNWGERARFDA